MIQDLWSIFAYKYLHVRICTHEHTLTTHSKSITINNFLDIIFTHTETHRHTPLSTMNGDTHLLRLPFRIK